MCTMPVALAPTTFCPATTVFIAAGNFERPHLFTATFALLFYTIKLALKGHLLFVAIFC